MSHSMGVLYMALWHQLAHDWYVHLVRRLNISQGDSQLRMFSAVYSPVLPVSRHPLYSDSVYPVL